jgi:hypothetical protein
MNRLRLYTRMLYWTSPLLLVLMWLQMMTGIGAFKGRLFRLLTLGLIDPAAAGKLHGVWLPVATATMVYLHAILGLQVMGRRLAWIRPKAAWEIGVYVLGIVLLAQFLVLYFG